MATFDCFFCDHAIEQPNEKVAHKLSKNHLISTHESELAADFRENHTDETCMGCEYTFPSERSDMGHPGLICPDCGRNHLNWWADRRAASRISGMTPD